MLWMVLQMQYADTGAVTSITDATDGVTDAIHKADAVADAVLRSSG